MNVSLLVIAASCLLLAACSREGGASADMADDRGGTAVLSVESPKLTRVLVKYCASPGQPTLSTITDPKQIEQLVSLILQSESPWRDSWHDKPMGTPVLVLYSGKEFRGRLEVGVDFLNLQCDGRFWSRTAAGEQTDAVMKLIGLEPIDP